MMASAVESFAWLRSEPCLGALFVSSINAYSQFSQKTNVLARRREGIRETILGIGALRRDCRSCENRATLVIQT
jgi:hypothetical protein